jgi:hypothetical protein
MSTGKRLPQRIDLIVPLYRKHNPFDFFVIVFCPSGLVNLSKEHSLLRLRLPVFENASVIPVCRVFLLPKQPQLPMNFESESYGGIGTGIKH